MKDVSSPEGTSVTKRGLNKQHTYIYNSYIYLYIHLYMTRDRERENKKRPRLLNLVFPAFFRSFPRKDPFKFFKFCCSLLFWSIFKFKFPPLCDDGIGESLLLNSAELEECNPDLRSSIRLPNLRPVNGEFKDVDNDPPLRSEERWRWFFARWVRRLNKVSLCSTNTQSTRLSRETDR